MERSYKLSRGWALKMLLVFLVQMEVARSLPSGAPKAACDDMTPSHDDYEPQTAESPYQLEVSTDAVVGGETVSVVLASDSEEAFEGFFIQARDTTSDEIVGTFQTTDWKYVDCLDGVENAITQPNSTTKTSVTADWVSPVDYDGVVVLRATVVQDFDVFWVGIESSEVTVTAAPSPIGSYMQKPVGAAYDGCAVRKGCFGFPDGCVDSQNCLVAITYAEAANGYSFEVFGTANPSAGDVYVAGGLSFDKNKADTSIMACRSFAGEVDVVMASNRAGHPDILPDPVMGLSDISTSQVNGLLYCSFTRQASLAVGGALYDLHSAKFLLEVAYGSLTGSGELDQQHQEIAAEAVSLGAFH